MNVATKKIYYQKYTNEFMLWPLADIHLGHETCDKKKLKEDIRKVGGMDNLIVVGLGDYLDSIRVTDKRYRKSMDDTISEAIIDEQIDEMVDILTPIKSNIVCLGDGNHELTIIKHGTNPVKRMCALLSTPDNHIEYFGISWMLKIIFQQVYSRGLGKSRSVIIRGHHGWGGASRTQGAEITKYSRDVMFWAADLFLFGHVHKIKADIVEEGRMVGNTWRTFQKKMMIAGTYQRTYTTDSNTTWAESEGFPPVTVGNPIAILHPDRDHGVDVKIIL